MTSRGSIEEKRPASLAELAYGLLYGDITNGRLAPGQKLLPAELSAKYAVGLSPLRDALNRLCADGLAVKREQKGFFVADLDEAEFLKITDARLVVEEAALRLSIAKGDQRWEDGVVLAFHRLSKVAAGGGKFVLTPEWSVAHEEFHFSLLAACENEWLLSFCRKLYEQSSRYRARRRLISAKGSLPVQRNLVKAHRDIMERSIARDADQAADLLVNHYRKTFELVMGSRYRVLDNPRHLVPDAQASGAGQPVDLVET